MDLNYDLFVDLTILTTSFSEKARSLSLGQHETHVKRSAGSVAEHGPKDEAFHKANLKGKDLVLGSFNDMPRTIFVASKAWMKALAVLRTPSKNSNSMTTPS